MTIQPPHATLYEEGREAEDGNDYGTASAKFQTAAALGDTRAQTRLVGVWAIGRAPESDYSEAVDWYREFSVIADINGGRQWETNLGDVYFLGLGVPQDDSEAVHWYEKGADKGDPKAQASLAAMYAEGRGLERDDVQAYRWFSLAGALPFVAQECARTKAKMTPEQIATAQHLIDTYVPSQASQGEDDEGQVFMPV